KLVVDCFRYISRDLRMVTTVHYTMHPAVSKLVGSHNTAVAKDATGHVKLDLVSDVLRLKRPFLFNKTCFRITMLKAKVLQVTFSGLVTYRAIQRVVY